MNRRYFTRTGQAATRDRNIVATQQGKKTKCLKTEGIIDKFTPLRPGLKDHPMEMSHRDFSGGMALYTENSTSTEYFPPKHRYSTSTDNPFW